MFGRLGNLIARIRYQQYSNQVMIADELQKILGRDVDFERDLPLSGVRVDRSGEDRRTKIYRDVEAELEYAHTRGRDGKTQGWDYAFDDRNTLNDWISYFGQYSARASKMGTPAAEQRAALVKVAGLVVSALETFDRNGGFAPRHYDPRAEQ